MDTRRKCDLSRLLEDTPESFYWLGFIVADGSFQFSHGAIKIALSSKDKTHLQQLQKFLSIEKLFERTIEAKGKTYIYCEISGAHREVFSEICSRYSIVQNKTKTPPRIDGIKEFDFLLSFIIGFIDGDGCIDHQTKRKDFKLRIKCDKSWLDNLQFFSNTIYRNFPNFNLPIAKVGTFGYALLSITNTVVLKWLKEQTIRMELPILKRKWDIIDLEFIGKYEQAKLNKEKIVNLYLDGKRKIDIINETSLSKSLVYKTIKHYKYEQKNK